MRKTWFVLLVLCVNAGASVGSELATGSSSPVIVATVGTRCQIEHAVISAGEIYVSLSEFVICLKGEIYLNRADGLIDVQLPGNKLLLWPWGAPLAFRDHTTPIVLSGEPWFWQEGFFYVSREALEELLGQAVAIMGSVELLNIRPTLEQVFRVDNIYRSAANGLKILIDPGHGGKDLGAKDSLGTYEKDIVLSVGLRLAALLREQGYLVKMTRTDDSYPTLSERVQLANEWNADLMLSLHCNSAQRQGAAGIETYVLSRQASDPRALALAQFENAFEAKQVDQRDDVAELLGDLARSAQEQSSYGLAAIFHKTLVSQLTTENRGVRKAPFFVLAGTTMPAFLVELGFLTNPDEAALLRQAEYQAWLAKSILAGVHAIRDYLTARSADATKQR